MTGEPQSAVTALLAKWRRGDAGALEDLLPLVYGELRQLAGHYMKSERNDHTIQATALVNEAFVRLVGMKVDWQDKAHFMSVAARAMRRILIDHARARVRVRRGGARVKVTLEDGLTVSEEPQHHLLDLDEALGRLVAIDERKGRAVELKYFGGLTDDEIAEVLGVSTPTVRRDLRQAKAWLYRELS